MTLRIDKAGRIVLPKPVRQRPSLVNRDGLLVHRGTLPKAYDWSRLIEDDRDERMRRLAGL